MKISEAIKFGILCVAVVISYTIGNFSLLDELLLVYIGAAFLFQWGGGLVIGIGLILELLVVLSKYNDRQDLSMLAPYPIWLIGSGVVLLLVPRIPSAIQLWRQNKTQRRQFFQELRMRWRASLTRSYRITVHMIGKAYHQWFGRFPGNVRLKIVLSIVVVPALFTGTPWAVDAIFLTAICFWLMLFVRDSRIPVAAAGLSFLGAVIFIVVRKRLFADVLILYGYYFLWTVLLVEIKRLALQYWRLWRKGDAREI